MASATTEFDALMKRAFRILHPNGKDKASFLDQGPGTHYKRRVKPDFVLPSGEWVDFKLHVSYRESQRVAWRPSPLYSSLRKYLDHPANSARSLVIVFGTLHGSINDAKFPVTRGNIVLIPGQDDFMRQIRFQSASTALANLAGQEGAKIRARIGALLRTEKPISTTGSDARKRGGTRFPTRPNSG